jgi:hypothetical protein
MYNLNNELIGAFLTAMMQQEKYVNIGQKNHFYNE